MDKINRLIELTLMLPPWVDAFSIDSITNFVCSQNGPFQCEYADNLKKFIGHSDFIDVEMALANSTQRARALLQTLSPEEFKG